MTRTLAVVLLLVIFILGFISSYPAIEVPSKITRLQSFSLATLYRIESNAYSDAPIKMIVLRGTHYQAGYAYGYLLAKEMLENYAHFLDNMFHNLVRFNLHFCNFLHLQGV